MRKELGLGAGLRRAFLRGAIAAFATLPAFALAQGAWPTKTVTIIVPFTAGGTTDIVGRLMAQKLSAVWGQNVIVENKAGAGGNIGGVAAAKSAPDGHTIFLPSGSVVTVNPHIYKSMGFDPAKDLIPVTNLASGPMLIAVNPKVPANTLAELIALAKAKPGDLNFGSAGQGSQVHMAGENFADAAGIDIKHVPYKGEALAYNDLMGGQIQMIVGNIAAASAFVNDGRLRALAVTSRERSKMLPNVPTAIEAGLAGFENTGWFGFMVPAGTPKEIVDKIHGDTVKVLRDPDVQSRLAGQGMVAIGNTPAEFTKQIATELQRWSQVVARRKLAAN